MKFPQKKHIPLADERDRWGRPHTDEAVEAVCEGRLEAIGQALYNDFEEILPLEDVQYIKQMMKDCGALGACMSGSGPSVFGLFAEKGEAEDCADTLRDRYGEVFVCSPTDHGCTIED